jgi:hypothetical protein
MTSPRIAAARKIPGVYYAATDDGVELPIVDIMHPAFALAVSDAEQESLVGRFLTERQPLERLPPLIRKRLLKLFLRGSFLGRDIARADGSFLSGMATYVLKLGPDNLGLYANRVDREIAASFPALTMRWRLQDTARLLSDVLARLLLDNAATPVHLLNIGGGPALDSLNALLLLKRELPASLVGRRFVVKVLDGDNEGPAFGARALASWLAEDAPLHGLDVVFQHVQYDWSQTQGLKGALDEARAERARIVGSSEGGLFEYGSDEEIVDNLRTLYEWTPHDFAVIGSVTRADAPMKRLRRLGTPAIRPRGLAVFRQLAQSAGFGVARVVERPFSDHVVLVREEARKDPRRERR